jgi:hypothetical protein
MIMYVLVVYAVGFSQAVPNLLQAHGPYATPGNRDFPVEIPFGQVWAGTQGSFFFSVMHGQALSFSLHFTAPATSIALQEIINSQCVPSSCQRSCHLSAHIQSASSPNLPAGHSLSSIITFYPT